MKDFGGKLAVITGGGTGMGRALARQLVAEGQVAEETLIAEKPLAAAQALGRSPRTEDQRVGGLHG